LRVDHDTEVAGLDNTKHGGTAYPDFNVTQVWKVLSPCGF